MRVEEGVFMEVLYSLNYGAIKAAAQGLLRATLVCDQRLEHGSYHVQLQTGKILLDKPKKKKTFREPLRHPYTVNT